MGFGVLVAMFIDSGRTMCGVKMWNREVSW